MRKILFFFCVLGFSGLPAWASDEPDESFREYREVRERAHMALIIELKNEKGVTLQDEDLWVGRDFLKLEIKELGYSREDYFRKVIFPKVKTLEPHIQGLSKFPQVFEQLEGLKRPLNDLDWQIYWEEHWRRFEREKFERSLPKGRGLKTEVLMSYDHDDGGFIVVRESLWTKMKDAKSEIELVAADLHLALYLWAELYKKEFQFDSEEFFRILPNLVAHILSDDDPDDFFYWYTRRLEKGSPIKEAVRVHSWALAGFVQHGPNEKEAAGKLLVEKCDWWEKTVREKLRSRKDPSIKNPNSEYVLNFGCRHITRNGRRTVEKAKLNTYTQWNWYLVNENGQNVYKWLPGTYQKWENYREIEEGLVLTIEGSAEGLPLGFFKIVETTEYGPFLPPGNEGVDYDKLKAEFDACSKAVESYLDPKFPASPFVYFAFCPVNDHRYDTVSFSNRVATGAHVVSGTSYTAGAGLFGMGVRGRPYETVKTDYKDVPQDVGGFASSEVVLVLSANHRIHSYEKKYSVEGTFPRNDAPIELAYGVDFSKIPGRYPPSFAELSQAFQSLPGAYQMKEDEARLAHPETFLMGVPYLNSPTQYGRSLNRNLSSPNFSVSAMAEFFRVRRDPIRPAENK